MTIATKDELVAHLVGSGHHVLTYGPQQHPSELDLSALRAWHDASHVGDGGDKCGTCSEDGHQHDGQDRLMAGTYTLHYISQDVRPDVDGSWSVYREQYVTAQHDEPIDGSQDYVSTHPTEALAEAEAGRLQRKVRLEYLRGEIEAERISYGEIAVAPGSRGPHRLRRHPAPAVGWRPRTPRGGSVITVPYGLGHVIPDTALAAWGMRAIVRQDGGFDILGDRMGTDGGPHSRDLLMLLNQRLPMDEVRDICGEFLIEGIMHTREAEDFILYSDDVLTVHANTNASAGYLYITAWLS